ALMVRRIHPQVRIVMRMFNQNLIARLGKAIQNVFALSTSSLTAPLFALTALTGQALGTFRLDGSAGGRRQIAEITVLPESPLNGQTVTEVATLLQGPVLAHVPAGGSGRFLREVEHDTRVYSGDRLHLCATPHRLTQYMPTEEESATGLLWAGILRRWAR